MLSFRKRLDLEVMKVKQPIKCYHYSGPGSNGSEIAHQVLSLQTRVDLRVMAMKEYSAFLKVLAFL